MLRLRFAAIMTAISAAMLMTIPIAAAQASVAKPPAPPAGFKGASVNAATARGATARIITLSPKTCAEYNQMYPGTVPDCRAKLYSYSRNRQALPREPPRRPATGTGTDQTRNVPSTAAGTGA